MLLYDTRDRREPFLISSWRRVYPSSNILQNFRRHFTQKGLPRCLKHYDAFEFVAGDVPPIQLP
jgi:hypothetical protein